MCRNIKTLFNFEPPATEDEIHASSLQFVRKLSGFTKPSQANAAAFERAEMEVSQVARTLLASLQTNAPARDRAVEAEKAKARARERFALVPGGQPAAVSSRRMTAANCADDDRNGGTWWLRMAAAALARPPLNQ